MHTHLRRLAVLPAAGVLALGIAGPASAHVTVTPSETAAGAYTVLTVSVPHGCDGSATTKIAVQLPESIVSVTPTRNALYDVEKVMQQLDEPITGSHGEEITERVAQVVYTATTPLPDGQRDAFELSLQIPEDAAGQTLAFPTVQSCEQGETAWTEIPADGQSADDLEHPAPAFAVTEAGAEAEPAAATSSAAVSAPVEVADDEGTNTLGILGLVAGLLGLALGGLALARTRGRA